MEDNKDKIAPPNPMINYLASLAYDTAKKEAKEADEERDNAEVERIEDVTLDILFEEAEKKIKNKYKDK